MTETLQGIAPISHLGIIRVQGDDAASFLHGQLTNDFVLLDQQHARLAAFCSAKGRMQASFIGFKRAPDDILLICSQDLLTRTLKRLSMFVLRAKAKLTDASADFQLFGLIGNAVPATEAPWTLHTQADGSHLVHLYPAAGQPRALLVAPVGTPAPQGTVLTPEQWLWTEVASGIAMVSEPVFELFVPQMLNYESVGGVNFKKGCYPGQEVVARSQFRGTLKRRAYIVHADQPLNAGQEVFAASDAEQATGTVVQAAPAPQGGWDAIVSMQIQSAQEALTAGSPEGVALTVQSLPYALLEDI
ncbi:CAF17-like 4Fe-4S cluster assembly/insertion protein YgfZ [Comamonas kerstersii]|uniref:Folate-binding protein YgfZ n=2 Tax=Comamonas kerstersii TaxID=225992 RepID=A0A1V3THX9_9BURK|nr:folate-binding protein YgfZ [Comamonas kerstersii]AQZ98886.1 folate-binding protein YgfZ [Comamonas kerstersii]OOH85606.1 folate-binding protein YgfZ [Comamonas kerstersii]OOH89455.1 folate-binding protein YgfZ [Comamonas kerstersii]HBW61234.1 folate-binding protein [Comamonas kerstersii]